MLWWAGCEATECWLSWHSELLWSLSSHEWRLSIGTSRGVWTLVEIINVCWVLWSSSREAVILLTYRLCSLQELSWSDYLFLTIFALFGIISFNWTKTWSLIIWSALLLLSVEWSIWCISITSNSQNTAFRLWFARNWWEYWTSICWRLIIQEVAWSIQNVVYLYWFSFNLIFIIIELRSLHKVCRCWCIIVASERSSEEVLEGLINFVWIVLITCALLGSCSEEWLERIVLCFWLSFWLLRNDWRDVWGWSVWYTTWAVEGIIILAVWSNHNWVDDWTALSSFGFNNWAILSVFGFHHNIVANFL